VPHTEAPACHLSARGRVPNAGPKHVSLKPGGFRRRDLGRHIKTNRLFHISPSQGHTLTHAQ
jgi:hypothetical protein